MKKLQANNLSKEEAMGQLKDLQAKLLQMKFDLSEKKLKDTTQLGKAKRDIARLLTVLNK